MDTSEEFRLAKKAIHGNPEAYGRLIILYQEYLYKIAFLYRLGCQKAYLKAAFYLYLENLTRLCLELIKGSIGE